MPRLRRYRKRGTPRLYEYPLAPLTAKPRKVCWLVTLVTGVKVTSGAQLCVLGTPIRV